MFFSWTRRVCACIAGATWLVYLVACALPGHLASGERVSASYDMVSNLRDLVSWPPLSAVLYVAFVLLWVFGGLAHSIVLFWKWGGSVRALAPLPLVGLAGMLYFSLQLTAGGDSAADAYMSPKYEVLPYALLVLASVQLLDLVMPPWYFLRRPKWNLGSVSLD